MQAYDTAYPDQLSTATVPIQVTRNEFAPIFSSAEYHVSLAENHRLGSSVLTVSAADDDQVGVLTILQTFADHVFIICLCMD